MVEDKNQKRSKDVDSLRTVQRALDILNTFSVEQNEFTLTEISSRIGLAKSTTTRLLATLETNGLVSKDLDTLRYKLGPKLSYLGYVANRSMRVGNIAAPIMKELRDRTKETVNLYLLDGRYRVCIAQMEGLQNLRHLVELGQKLPLWAGAGGKVLLAFQSPSFQDDVKGLVESEERWGRLQQEFSEIVRVGYAWSRDEREIGSSAVAAPIFSVTGSVRHCLSISGPTQRFSMEKIEELHVLVKQGAKEISTKIGYSGSAEEEWKDER